MPDTPPDELDTEYDAARAAQLLDDEAYTAIKGKDRAEVAALDPDLRAKFFATDKWHAEKRMTFDDLGGIVVGGKSIDEILKG